MSARNTTTGIHQAKPALPKPSREPAPQNLRTQYGTITAQTASSPRHGLTQAGILQVTLRLTAQVPEPAATHAQAVTPGTGTAAKCRRFLSAAHRQARRA